MQDDLIQCKNCGNHVFKKCAVIHEVACFQQIMKQSQKIQPTKIKQRGFFDKLFHFKDQQEEQAYFHEEEIAMIPCTECGDSIPFHEYQQHINMCVGHQLTQCKQCHLKYPNFLIQEHYGVCQGEVNIQNQVEDIELNNMIASLANQQQQKMTEQPLTKQQIKGLRIIKLTKNEDCCICCVEMNKGLDKIKLNCQHLFHKNCISTWLQRNPFCPMCRKHALSK